MSNCKNCGAVLGNGKYCQYCGTDTGRTEYINLKMPISKVPTKTVCAQIPVPVEAQDEKMIKKYLLSKICVEIHKDIDSMELQSDTFNINPLDNTIIYQTRFCYAFL